MSASFLTDAEVKDLTGYVQPKRQARWLADNGIKFFLNARGLVRVPAEALMLKPIAKQRRTEPDFTKVRKAS